ncbi:hypothetical protein GCM10022403_084520 [Streptomyces coacervatus]|uniref:Uncharacterized protein n=1 Tax=Streptomyces coacervatus TaxID=647381 RepID=A0ABP7JB86_9ACTN
MAASPATRTYWIEGMKDPVRGAGELAYSTLAYSLVVEGPCHRVWSQGARWRQEPPATKSYARAGTWAAGHRPGRE